MLNVKHSPRVAAGFYQEEPMSAVLYLWLIFSDLTLAIYETEADDDCESYEKLGRLHPLLYASQNAVRTPPPEKGPKYD